MQKCLIPNCENGFYDGRVSCPGTNCPRKNVVNIPTEKTKLEQLKNTGKEFLSALKEYLLFQVQQFREEFIDQ